MSSRLYQSTLLDARIHSVWSLIRPLNFEYLPTVASVKLLDGAGESDVGGQRNITYNDKDKTTQTISLLELSESNHTITWEVVKSEPAISVMSIVHTIELFQVTETNKTFLQWTTDFSSDATKVVIEDARYKQKENFDALSKALVNESDITLHVLPAEIPVSLLEVKQAFEKLTTKEKLYAHYMSKACWLGSEIVFTQVSNESPIIFQLFQTIFSNVTSIADYRHAALSNSVLRVSSSDFDDFLNYVAMFYTNMGNYLSFGDSKFVPRIPKSKFRTIIEASLDSKCKHSDSKENLSLKDTVQKLLSKCIDRIYSLQRHERSLGFPGIGISTYYNETVTKSEMELVGEFMVKNRISPYNTRLFKLSNEPLQLELKLASVNTLPKQQHSYKGATIYITTGDHSNLLMKVVENLKKAKQYVANEYQDKMIDAYIQHFLNGDIEHHKQAQREWIKDVGPVVETNIGFIESYRDPLGARGEFEGFVAVVNKETSRKFGELVNQATKFLAKLPWNKDFEKDEFKRPDFTSLEVISFSGSGIPAGINIPNYDDIRQSEGFKNVSLGNVLAARASNKPVTFLREEDQKLYNALKVPSFEVQVGGHELLGHGSGKLFMETDKGFNFSPNIINPLTGDKITTYYRSGETYDHKFSTISSSYEECRAECVGVYLSADRELLKIFGYEDTKAQDDIMYINWLNMARAGIVALEYYSPDKKHWRQAHMQARFGILQVMIEAGQGFVTLDVGKDDLTISIDRSKIISVGVPAVGKFLQKLQIYKATADVDAAQKLYKEYTDVNEKYVSIRRIVLQKKTPRPMFVQVSTRVNDKNEAYLEEFPSTCEGIIQSMLSQFRL